MRPARSYLPRPNIKLENLNVMIDAEVRKRMTLFKRKEGTSLARLAEAAIKWYLDSIGEKK